MPSSSNVTSSTPRDKRCARCGGAVTTLMAACPYCAMPVVSNRALAAEDRHRAWLFAHMLDEQLGGLSTGNMARAMIKASVIGLLVGHVIFLGVYLLAGSQWSVLLILPIVIWSFTYYLAQEAVLSKQAQRTLYEQTLKPKIDAFLLSHGFTRYEFDVGVYQYMQANSEVLSDLDAFLFRPDSKVGDEASSEVLPRVWATWRAGCHELEWNLNQKWGAYLEGFVFLFCIALFGPLYHALPSYGFADLLWLAYVVPPVIALLYLAYLVKMHGDTWLNLRLEKLVERHVVSQEGPRLQKILADLQISPDQFRKFLESRQEAVHYWQKYL